MKTASVAKAAAVTGLLLIGATGPASIANAGQKAESPDAPKAQAHADRARAALNANKADAAVRAAEDAVALSPQDAALRRLLGQAYAAAGRYRSAETAFSDALALGQADAASVIGLAVAKAALDKRGEAVALLDAHAPVLRDSDLGLALAVAGDTDRALPVLMAAARSPEATAQTRQNLAYALAMAGKWLQARVVASQDIDGLAVDRRMEQWSQMALSGADQRVASLMGVKLRSDSGQPDRLALRSAPGEALAMADPAPLAQFAPRPDVTANGAAPEAAPVPPAAIVVSEEAAIMADASETPASEKAPRAAEPAQTAVASAPVAVETRTLAAPVATRAAAAPAVAEKAAAPAPTARVKLPKVAVAPVFKPVKVAALSGRQWAVQVGAFGQLNGAIRGWGLIQSRHGLKGHDASSYKAQVRGKAFYRLTVNGLASERAARNLCSSLKAKGQPCFVRVMGGSETIMWASRKPVQLASR